MNGSVFKDIDKLEADLWSAADNLRANSKLTSSDYFLPVLGIIFLRHAANRYEAATRQIKDDQAAGRMPKRRLVDADYVRRRALPLPPEARYDWIMNEATSGPDPLPRLVANAMTAIEARFDPLKGVLPKDYGIFEPKVLEELMRHFNSEQIRNATGDVFGRIYEYFLAKFSIQKAHDNGEFFTPSSLVQMIVNVIEPNHGKVFDPACGSGGMFVQTSHFIEHAGGDTARKVVFYGQEKNPDTIHIALMNLAVHGLTGEIAEAITYYEDKHNLVGGCDFVMANPPFNVDLVDAERVKTDHRLPFGLPGVNKQKKVSNGNYLWISYFWSYLNKTGRAGFVMSSQASSAGHGEKDVRQRIVETGDVDVMMSIRSNFFYTRTVPCELWFFDRGKSTLPSPRGGEGLGVRGPDTVLMIDARNVYRKVNRTINDFAPEQMANLSAIVWLYRGQQERFIKLVGDYLAATAAEADKVGRVLGEFEFAFGSIDEVFANVRMEIEEVETPLDDTTDFIPAADEVTEAYEAYSDDRTALQDAISRYRKKHATPRLTIADLRAAHEAYEPIAERLRGMVKQIDLVAKLTATAGDAARDLIKQYEEANGADLGPFVFDRRYLAKRIKELDASRKQATDQLKNAAYFHRQAEWLLHRFPEGKLADVPGLVKLVRRADIAAADWSLTPGRYVGVAPAEVDEDFDFEQTVRGHG